ncbi:tyrosine-type recombinase/integrase [Roseovarius sp. A-2]|uniref:tyrosine-type recombinase/integrase n=1 Tax=Roseovarius sp. A-2 TaxID=1570360 RepID=UPI0035E3F726
MNFEEKTWTKRVKGGHQVTHPLSDAAIDLLKALPGFDRRKNDDLLFPNQEFGQLGNWNRSKLQLQEISSVGDWHRHDLRRTGATILTLFGIPPKSSMHCFRIRTRLRNRRSVRPCTATQSSRRK